MGRIWENVWSGLGLDKAEFPQVVALVGSGGKTSLLGQLAKAGKEYGMRVAVLTSTHMWKPQVYRETFSVLEKGTVTVFGRDCGNGKITYPGEDYYREICRGADLILVEADGSRGLPVKYPGPREPVIPDNVNRILCVCGLSGLGRPGREVCHRWELVPETIKEDRTKGENDGMEEVTEELLVHLLEEGYGKPLTKKYPEAEFYYCMNQADSRKLATVAERILRRVGRKGVVLSLKTEENILYKKGGEGKHRIAFIYMASGFGTRYGANKLLEIVEGKPLYCHGLQVLAQAAAELSGRVTESPAMGTECGMEARLIVVSQYDEILKSAKQMGAVPVYNPDSGEGITASIHLGIEVAGQEPGVFDRTASGRHQEGTGPGAWKPEAYLFSVADQPWLKVESVVRLVRDFFESDKTMACLTDGRRNGNPVIFDVKYERELRNLTGDKGGSRVLRRYPDEVLQVQVKERELRDVDSPGDA